MSSITALPAVVAAVGKRTEEHVDGGIQSGQDVFKAIAIIHKELDTTMGLCGVRAIAATGRQNLVLERMGL